MLTAIIILFFSYYLARYALFAFGQHMAILLFFLIAFSYLIICPSLNALSIQTQDFPTYLFYESIIIVAFFIPFLGFLLIGKVSSYAMAPDSTPDIVVNRLSPFIPLVLLLLICVFWYVVLSYGLVFRRLGHEGLQNASSSVPALFLYLYRITTEISFFTVIFLQYAIRNSNPDTRYRNLYKCLLTIFLVSFSLYFIINSRMQFLLLVLLASFLTKAPRFKTKKIFTARSAVVMVFLVILMTLLRELLLEDSSSIQMGSFFTEFISVGQLIVQRLDVLTIFYELDNSNYNPLAPHLSGLYNTYEFYVSFIMDYDNYQAMKASLLTSSSVIVINEVLGSGFVDFPKSLVVDGILIFGVLGLPLIAAFYAWLLWVLQSKLTHSDVTKIPFILALYFIPLLFQFEKELLSPFISALKWSPVLLLFLVFRPCYVRAGRRVDVRNTQGTAMPPLISYS